MHLLSSTAFHGAESMTLQLAAAQRDRGDDVVVALFDAGNAVCDELESRFSAAGVSTRRIPCRGRLDYRVIRHLRGLAVQGRFDVLHSHKYKCTLHALLAVGLRRFPLVATYHNWILTDRNLRLYAALDKRLARWCAACVAVSSEVRAELERYVPASRVRWIANGIDTMNWSASADGAALRRALGLQNVPVVGFVGRLTPEKGLDLLIDALALLEPIAGGVVHALLAGDGPGRAELEARVAARGLQGRVRFVGAVADTRSVYGAADVLVLPSLTEGLPMTALEAMACERVLIATAVGELPALIRPGETGWLLPERNASLFAKMLAEALSDPARLQQMGKRARLHIEKAHSAAAMAAAYAQVYSEVRAPEGARAGVI